MIVCFGKSTSVCRGWLSTKKAHETALVGLALVRFDGLPAAMERKAVVVWVAVRRHVARIAEVVVGWVAEAGVAITISGIGRLETENRERRDHDQTNRHHLHESLHCHYPVRWRFRFTSAPYKSKQCAAEGDGASTTSFLAIEFRRNIQCSCYLRAFHKRLRVLFDRTAGRIFKVKVYSQ